MERDTNDPLLKRKAREGLEREKGEAGGSAGSQCSAAGRTLPIVPGQLTIDPDDPEVQWILSKTCLTCGPIAHVFQRAGYPIPTHAEEEQMHVLLWMLARYKQHGPDWRGKCDAELRTLLPPNSVLGHRPPT